MQITRLSANVWQISRTPAGKVAALTSQSTPADVNEAAARLGLSCQQIGQVITVICSPDQPAAAKMYGIDYHHWTRLPKRQ